LKPGELSLKGGNRKIFEGVLKRNLLRMLGASQPGLSELGAPKPKIRIEITNGRFFVHCDDGDCALVEGVLSRLMGISGWARTGSYAKTVEVVLRACVEEGKKLFEQGLSSFKIEARRTDKSFPLDSYGLRSEGGKAILDAVPGLKVDVHNPEGLIRVEIREKAYVYSNSRKGLGGLPVGTAGRGILLLSGGIDSPVAGFLMASRGMGIDAVYFHAYPYTSPEARQKVIRLAEIVGAYCMGIRLHIAGFTKIQARIKERVPSAWTTVLLRMAMVDCAEKLALSIKGKCLITGESLSQVASQTIENLSCTQAGIGLPILRPLIGAGKESIIKMAEQIGTYETSILPYEDCCVLFSPPHPILRGDPLEASALYESLELKELIEEALRNRETIKCGFY
jgi:thiamine biosynthesis protein ThiI